MTEYSQEDMARAWERQHDELCPSAVIPGEAECYHNNPYAAPAPDLPPEPPVGVGLIDGYGVIWQKLNGDGGYYQSTDGDGREWHLMDHPLTALAPVTPPPPERWMRTSDLIAGPEAPEPPSQLTTIAEDISVVDLPPEPPVGTVVLDSVGDAWQRGRASGGYLDQNRWFPIDGSGFCSWEDLNDENEGIAPLTVLAPVTPPPPEAVEWAELALESETLLGPRATAAARYIKDRAGEGDE